MQIDFDEREIKTIFLDVRGTVLSPWDDAPMPARLCQALGECLQNKIKLVIATATSLASTGLGFVIEPLLYEFQRRKLDDNLVSSCLAYVESGTVAYRLSCDWKIIPLESFKVLKFTDEEKTIAELIISQVCHLYHRGEIERKFKPGQVNCYVGGPWTERRQIADEMNNRFQQKGVPRLIAQVPSARETIDVAICTKSRIAKDYLTRSNVLAHEILIFGDSLQVGANDEPLSKELPGSIAVQVGDINPEPHIYHPKRSGPEGVLEAIMFLLSKL